MLTMKHFEMCDEQKARLKSVMRLEKYGKQS